MGQVSVKHHGTTVNKIPLPHNGLGPLKRLLRKVYHGYRQHKKKRRDEEPIRLRIPALETHLKFGRNPLHKGRDRADVRLQLLRDDHEALVLVPQTCYVVYLQDNEASTRRPHHPAGDPATACLSALRRDPQRCRLV